MARLIDADALLEEHCGDCYPKQREMCKNDPVCGSAMWIIEAPTVDAVPVVHGRWVWTETGEEDYEQYWACSKCGEHTYFITNFCSNCGAKMDLEEVDA